MSIKKTIKVRDLDEVVADILIDDYDNLVSLKDSLINTIKALHWRRQVITQSEAIVLPDESIFYLDRREAQLELDIMRLKTKFRVTNKKLKHLKEFLINEGYVKYVKKIKSSR